MAYSWWYHGKVPDAPHNAFQLRQEFAQKALDLDDSLALPHELLGVTHQVNGEWNSAEKELLQALALDPSSSNAHALLAFQKLAMGRREEALVEMRRAQNLDPLEPYLSHWVGEFLGYLGRHREATRHLELAREIAPDHVEATEELARNYARLREGAKARPFIHKYHELRGDGAEAASSAARAYEVGGWAGYLEWNLAQPGNPALVRAGWFAELGRLDEALAALEQACQKHDPNIHAYLLGNSVFDSLHDEPRFRALLRRKNLPG
jgi:tetratricopeptide (TPR) repeat protein